MSLRKILATILLSGVFSILAFGALPVMAQSSGETTQAENKEDETNLDTQLYLLVATNQEVDNVRLPAVLDPVIKQLRSALPFKNYRLAATLINRVKNDGRLDLKWIGGPLSAPSATASASTPSFNEFKVRTVRVFRNSEGQQMVQMAGFGFGARIPIQTAALASTGPAPIINYESTGLNTDISMREGEPVIVGTLNVGPSGDAIILVVSAKRTLK